MKGREQERVSGDFDDLAGAGGFARRVEEIAEAVASREFSEKNLSESGEWDSHKAFKLGGADLAAKERRERIGGGSCEGFVFAP